MAISRRQFLRSFGAVSVAVVGGGVFRAVDQGVFTSGRGPAFEAWEDWRTEQVEGPMRLVQAGILAASPHNTQPWLFKVNRDQITIYADTARHLGTMDPYLREMHIGLGCAIENMMLTAAATGYGAALSLEGGTLTPPAGNPQMEKVATLTLTPTAAQSNALFDAIPRRHTSRYNYDASRLIPARVVAELAEISETEDGVKLYFFQKGEQAFQTMADATIDATEAIIADHAMAHDSFAWVDQSWQEMQREKDGPYIDTSGSTAATRTLVKMLPSTSQAQYDAGWLSGTQSHMQNTAILGLIAVRDLYDKQKAMQSGRVWQRLHLGATTKGLVMQPINQIPEIVDRDRQLGQPSPTADLMSTLTGGANWRPTFAFRMGYPLNDVLPSARRPLEEVLL